MSIRSTGLAAAVFIAISAGMEAKRAGGSSASEAVMGIDGQSAHHEIADPGGVEGLHDGIETGEFHWDIVRYQLPVNPVS
jgi:hypothetical protein